MSFFLIISAPYLRWGEGVLLVPIGVAERDALLPAPVFSLDLHTHIGMAIRVLLCVGSCHAKALFTGDPKPERLIDGKIRL